MSDPDLPPPDELTAIVNMLTEQLTAQLKAMIEVAWRRGVRDGFDAAALLADQLVQAAPALDADAFDWRPYMAQQYRLIALGSLPGEV